MCGICGIMCIKIDHAGAVHLPPFDGLIDRMTDSLVHRGPDDRGIWQYAKGEVGRIALGSRRLSIIDLSPAGHMPMANEDGTVVITYNGEVYNFRELRDRFKLDEKGHIFRSRTDTEVLLHLYEELGIEMVKELNGMFAIAIWDARNQDLILMRDRFGVKPLFYQRDENYFRFGSEIKAILSDPRVPRRPSIQALHDFLTFDYIPGQQTAFEGISELPPSHWMIIDKDGQIKMQRYWDLSFDVDDSIDETTAVKGALELMDRSVERRLIADVPIGVMLSGGMDSSTIVALMSRHTTEPIHTYSVGFEQSSFNELPYARIVARRFRTIQREIVVTPELVRDMLPKYLSYIDEPFADGSAIPTYYVCQIAKDDVVVVLSGEGGDEAFVGYDTYTAYRVSRWFNKVPRWLRQRVISPVVNRLPASDKKLSLEFKLKRFLGGQDIPVPLAHLWWRIVLTEAQKLNLYRPQVLERLQPEASERHYTKIYESLNGKDDLSRLLYLDGRVFLPDDLMIKNDRMSMAHSLEARVPMVDPELTEFMSRVPARVKFPGLRKKHIMRKAMEGLLPAAILNKKKVGLEIPYSFWFKNHLKDLLLDYLGTQRVGETGLFKPEAVQLLVDDHLTGKVDNGRALWGLLNYMMWLELYIQ
jgi:asparagine synthase (glutamine-hydrolysing)